MPPTTPDRPVGLGASISHAGGEPGSLGPVVRRLAGTDWFCLSASHVFAPVGAANDDDIVQPATARGGTVRIARLFDFESLQTSGVVNQYDAAIARITNLDDIVPRLPVIGEVGDTVIAPRRFASVRKFGAATLHTLGVITDPSATARFVFDGNDYEFGGVIEVVGCGGEFSQGGDSGALVVDALSQRPLGLIIGGTGKKTYVSPLGRILDRFACRLLSHDEVMAFGHIQD